MLLHVSALGEQPIAGTAGDLAVSEGQPVVLTLQPLSDEQLDMASLVVHGPSAPGPSPTPVELGSSNDGLWTGVTWVMATWDSVRSVETLTLGFASKPDPLVVRVSIAKGGSGWFLPPGPHTFTLGPAMQLQAVLPDTVADRVLVELLDEEGTPVAVDLNAAAPLVVQLGRAPRELELRVRGRRPLLRWSGGIPAQGWVVEDLCTRLRDELGSELRGEEITLELRAAVAGEVELSWELDTVRVTERFIDGASTRSVALGWASELHEALLPVEAGVVELQSLALAVDATPSQERLVFGSGAGGSTGNGQLVGLLHDAAQLIELEDEAELTAIDVLVRGLVDGTTVTLGVHADDSGRPAVASLMELSQSIDARMTEPGWISFGLPAPSLVTAGRWWVVLRVGEGELMWLVASGGGGTGLFHRRDRASWLGCLPSRCAMVRVRARGEPPSEPVTLSLRGVPADGVTPAWELPLAIAEDGIVRWSADDGPALPASTQLSLGVAAEVTSSVVLSKLALCYRVSLP